MFEKINIFIMTWLDPIGVVVGLVMFVPVVLTWYEVTLGRRRRERKWRRQVAREPGSRPGILIVDLLPGKKIGVAVENHRQQDKALKPIPRDRIFLVQRDRPLTPDDMPQLARDIANQSAAALQAGVDTLHCFYAGPAPGAALVGAELANGCRVILYHHNKGRYENFGPLRALEYR